MLDNSIKIMLFFFVASLVVIGISGCKRRLMDNHLKKDVVSSEEKSEGLSLIDDSVVPAVNDDLLTTPITEVMLLPVAFGVNVIPEVVFVRMDPDWYEYRASLDNSGAYYVHGKIRSKSGLLLLAEGQNAIQFRQCYAFDRFFELISEDFICGEWSENYSWLQEKVSDQIVHHALLEILRSDQFFIRTGIEFKKQVSKITGKLQECSAFDEFKLSKILEMKPYSSSQYADLFSSVNFELLFSNQNINRENVDFQYNEKTSLTNLEQLHWESIAHMLKNMSIHENIFDNAIIHDPNVSKNFSQLLDSLLLPPGLLPLMKEAKKNNFNAKQLLLDFYATKYSENAPIPTFNHSTKSYETIVYPEKFLANEIMSPAGESYVKMIKLLKQTESGLFLAEDKVGIKDQSELWKIAQEQKKYLPAYESDMKIALSESDPIKRWNLMEDVTSKYEGIISKPLDLWYPEQKAQYDYAFHEKAAKKERIARKVEVLEVERARKNKKFLEEMWRIAQDQKKYVPEYETDMKVALEENDPIKRWEKMKEVRVKYEGIIEKPLEIWYPEQKMAYDYEYHARAAKTEKRARSIEMLEIKRMKQDKRLLENMWEIAKEQKKYVAAYDAEMKKASLEQDPIKRWKNMEQVSKKYAGIIEKPLELWYPEYKQKFDLAIHEQAAIKERKLRNIQMADEIRARKDRKILENMWEIAKEQKQYVSKYDADIKIALEETDPIKKWENLKRVTVDYAGIIEKPLHLWYPNEKAAYDLAIHEKAAKAEIELRKADLENLKTKNKVSPQVSDLETRTNPSSTLGKNIDEQILPDKLSTSVDRTISETKKPKTSGIIGEITPTKVVAASGVAAAIGVGIWYLQGAGLLLLTNDQKRSCDDKIFSDFFLKLDLLKKHVDIWRFYRNLNLLLVSGEYSD